MGTKKVAKNLLQGKLCTNCLKNSVCVREQPGNMTCADWESRIVFGNYVPAQTIVEAALKETMIHSVKGPGNLRSIAKILELEQEWKDKEK